jgi:hypothetical protein
MGDQSLVSGETSGSVIHQLSDLMKPLIEAIHTASSLCGGDRKRHHPRGSRTALREADSMASLTSITDEQTILTVSGPSSANR